MQAGFNSLPICTEHKVISLNPILKLEMPAGLVGLVEMPFLELRYIARR